ncbi:MAG: DUF6250 domain-containing protein [Pseudomonadota bacterium]
MRLQISALALAAMLLSPPVMSIAHTAPAACVDWGRRGMLLHQDEFDGPMSGYVSEFAAGPGNVVEARDGRLLIDVAAGATVWLAKPMSGNVHISYTRRVVVDGGRNDRLSDLNHFWMARDPRGGKLFGRSGRFEEYDDLDLYYVGIGGNGNTTTRMRRYGNGERVLVGEHADTTHLLKANHDYQVDIMVYQGCTRVLVDGREYFSYRDPQPYNSGYFGFRTTWSRQAIDHLKIYRLE